MLDHGGDDAVNAGHQQHSLVSIDREDNKVVHVDDGHCPIMVDVSEDEILHAETT